MDRDRLIWLFFSMSGRVSRAVYLLAGLLANLVPAFLFYRFLLAPEESSQSGMWALAFMLVGIVSVYSVFALSVKRLHDFGKPGAFAVALFIPFLSYVAFIAFCIVPGDSGPNQYGKRTNERA